MREVTEAKKGHFVFLHLYVDSSEECQMVNEMMEVKAKEHPDIKFLKIVGQKCIPNFKDS